MYYTSYIDWDIRADKERSMSQTVSISKARARLPALSKQMSKARRPEALAITQKAKQGKRIPWEAAKKELSL